MNYLFSNEQKEKMRGPFSKEVLSFLCSPFKQFGYEVLVLIFLIYQLLTEPNSYPNSFLFVIFLLTAATLFLLKKPRWMVYIILMLMLIAKIYVYTQIISNGEHDLSSTRDLAVEVTARYLLDGENAWNVDIGVGVTTGPTSILLSLPFVLFFCEINWLSFIFWVILFLIFLWADIKYQNNSWPFLVMIFMLGIFDIDHTLNWSLEELYYPVLFLFIAFIFIKKKKWMWAGIIFAAIVLTRLNYLILLAGFGLWLLNIQEITWKVIANIILGFVLGFILILLPFVIVGKEDLLVNNPWKFAFDFGGANWPDTNYVFHILNKIYAHLGNEFVRLFKLIFTLILMIIISLLLKKFKFEHPFWHITMAALIAHTFVWMPARLHHDYSLVIVLPSMIALAMTNSQAENPKMDLS